MSPPHTQLVFIMLSINERKRKKFDIITATIISMTHNHKQCDQFSCKKMVKSELMILYIWCWEVESSTHKRHSVPQTQSMLRLRKHVYFFFCCWLCELWMYFSYAIRRLVSCWFLFIFDSFFYWHSVHWNCGSTKCIK